jgi:hypothetical protein
VIFDLEADGHPLTVTEPVSLSDRIKFIFGLFQTLDDHSI